MVGVWGWVGMGWGKVLLGDNFEVLVVDLFKGVFGCLVGWLGSMW